jgi:hypothetical protein
MALSLIALLSYLVLVEDPSEPADQAPTWVALIGRTDWHAKARSLDACHYFDVVVRNDGDQTLDAGLAEQSKRQTDQPDVVVVVSDRHGPEGSSLDHDEATYARYVRTVARTAGTPICLALADGPDAPHVNAAIRRACAVHGGLAVTTHEELVAALSCILGQAPQPLPGPQPPVDCSPV